jgi:hypothetical protein
LLVVQQAIHLPQLIAKLYDLPDIIGNNYKKNKGFENMKGLKTQWGTNLFSMFPIHFNVCRNNRQVPGYGYLACPLRVRLRSMLFSSCFVTANLTS